MAKTYQCPYCETNYRHRNMALRCMRTQTCKMFNAPGGKLRQEWEIQAGAVAVAIFMAGPVRDQHSGKPKEIAEAIVAACEELCGHLRERTPVGKIVAERQCDRLYATADKVWGDKKKAMVVHICEVTSNIVADVLDYYRQRWANGEYLDGKVLWEKLDALIDELYDTINPEGAECDESWRTPVAYEALRLAIWGPEKEEREPSVYLANDRFWIVGRGRAEARDCLLREYGLSRPKIIGVAPGTKLEDGGVAADLIPLAVKVPAIVAMAPV